MLGRVFQLRISDETYYALDGPASDVLDVPERATCMNKAQNGRQTVVWPFAHDRLGDTSDMGGWVTALSSHPLIRLGQQ